MLLRGRDREMFDKYYGNFGKEEMVVKQELLALKELLGKSAVKLPEIDQLIGHHSELGVQYRAALKHFDAGNSESYRLVDQAVMGIDRASTNAMDELVEKDRAAGERAAQRQ